MTKTARKLRALGFATRTKTADRTRSALRRARSINANLHHRSDDRLAEVRRINSELVVIARRVADDVDAVLRNAKRKLKSASSGRARRLVGELARTAELTRRIADQTAERMAGGMPAGARRIVSLHDGRCPGDQEGPPRKTRRVRLQEAFEACVLASIGRASSRPRRCTAPRDGGESE
jgi:IS5 family transposase